MKRRNERSGNLYSSEAPSASDSARKGDGDERSGYARGVGDEHVLDVTRETDPTGRAIYYLDRHQPNRKYLDAGRRRLGCGRVQIIENGRTGD